MTEPTKSMRIRVNASRTAKGYSVDCTYEIGETTDLALDSGYLESIALNRLESLMAKLNAQYPREIS